MKKFTKITSVVTVLILAIALCFTLVACNYSTDGSGALNELIGRITDSADDTSTSNNNNSSSGNNSNNITENTHQITLGTTTAAAENFSYETVSDVVEAIQNSVVEINVTLESGTSAGSGVFVAKSEDEGYSYIMTCLHVVENYQSIQIILANGDKYTAQFVGGVPDDDIAVLRIAHTEGITCAKIRDVAQSPIRIAETAIAIGNPLGTLGGTVTKGIISSLARTINVEGSVMTLLQTDAAINSGNSGGALFDENGLLIGIVNAKYSSSGVEGLGFAIPIETAREVAQSLLNTRGNSAFNGFGYIEGKIMLGITTQNGSFTSAVTTTNNNTYTTFSLVSVISSYGSAYKSTLSLEDYIVAVDGEKLSDTHTISSVLATKNVGDTMTLTVLVASRKTYSSYTYTEKDITINLIQYVYGYVA